MGPRRGMVLGVLAEVDLRSVFAFEPFRHGAACPAQLDAFIVEEVDEERRFVSSPSTGMTSSHDEDAPPVSYQEAARRRRGTPSSEGQPGTKIGSPGSSHVRPRSSSDPGPGARRLHQSPYRVGAGTLSLIPLMTQGMTRSRPFRGKPWVPTDCGWVNAGIAVDPLVGPPHGPPRRACTSSVEGRCSFPRRCGGNSPRGRAAATMSTFLRGSPTERRTRTPTMRRSSSLPGTRRRRLWSTWTTCSGLLRPLPAGPVDGLGPA